MSTGVPQAAAAVSVAAIQSAVAYNVANKQYGIAKEQNARSQELHDAWRTNHLPAELRLLSELMAKPAYVPQYQTVSARASNDVATAFGKSRAEARRNMPIYCVGGLVAIERQLATAQALVEADAITSARAREDGRADLKEQQLIDNKARMVALGRGLLDQSGAAARSATAGMAAGGATVASAVNSAGQMLGYLSTRNFDAGRQPPAREDPTQGVTDFIQRNGVAGYQKMDEPMNITGFVNPPVTGKELTQPGVPNAADSGGWAGGDAGDDRGH